jgi:hypothetical protein
MNNLGSNKIGLFNCGNQAINFIVNVKFIFYGNGIAVVVVFLPLVAF